MSKHFVDERELLLIKEIKATQLTKFPNLNLLLAVFAVCIGGSFQYGFNLSVINGPNMYVQNFINQTFSERYQIDISEYALTLLWSTIVSAFTIGGFIGAAVSGTLAIKLGRKRAMLSNNLFALMAALLMGLSYPTGLFELLIVGRLLSGINAGIGLGVQTLYLSEIAPTNVRGAMGMGTSLFITSGILIGQVVSLKELLGREEQWPILLSTTCIPAFMQLLILPWSPESPRFLLIDRGDVEGCKKALKQLQPAGYDQELKDIEEERINLVGVHAKTPWDLLGDRSVRWQLITIILLNMAQQLNGINAFYSYGNYLFKQAGIPADIIPYATMGTGACECVTALTCGMLIERLGRRALIIGGYTLMSICCFLLTLTLSFQTASPVIPYLGMACVFAFILSFGLGPGGVTNILSSELFTQSARPAAYIIAGSVNWLSFFVIGLVFPFIVLFDAFSSHRLLFYAQTHANQNEKVTLFWGGPCGGQKNFKMIGLQQYCFLVFLIVCSLMGLYIFLIIPETKKKTFLEIQNAFHSSNNRMFSHADGAGTVLL